MDHLFADLWRSPEKHSICKLDFLFILVKGRFFFFFFFAGLSTLTSNLKKKKDYLRALKIAVSESYIILRKLYVVVGEIGSTKRDAELLYNNKKMKKNKRALFLLLGHCWKEGSERKTSRFLQASFTVHLNGKKKLYSSKSLNKIQEISTSGMNAIVTIA